MKLKMTILFAALVMLADVLSAGPIIILSGGGKNGKYNYVYQSDGKIVCKGSGHEVCPVKWYQAAEGPVIANVQDIVDYVSSLVNRGEKSGEIKYKDAIPVRWDVTEDNEMQIKIDSEFKEIPHD